MSHSAKINFQVTQVFPLNDQPICYFTFFICKNILKNISLSPSASLNKVHLIEYKFSLRIQGHMSGPGFVEVQSDKVMLGADADGEAGCPCTKCPQMFSTF